MYVHGLSVNSLMNEGQFRTQFSQDRSQGIDNQEEKEVEDIDDPDQQEQDCDSEYPLIEQVHLFLLSIRKNDKTKITVCRSGFMQLRSFNSHAVHHRL